MIDEKRLNQLSKYALVSCPSQIPEDPECVELIRLARLGLEYEKVKEERKDTLNYFPFGFSTFGIAQFQSFDDFWTIQRDTYAGTVYSFFERFGRTTDSVMDRIKIDLKRAFEAKKNND